jgi:hypothetical protein
MALVKLGQLLERIVTDDIGVQDEEWRVVFGENILCQFQGTSGAEGFSLNGELDLYVVLLFVLFRHIFCKHSQHFTL